MPQSKVISASVFIYYRFLYSLLLDQFQEIRQKNIQTWKIFSIRVEWLLFYWVHKGKEYWCLNLQFWSQCDYCGYFCPFYSKTYLSQIKHIPRPTSLQKENFLIFVFPPRLYHFSRRTYLTLYVIGSLLHTCFAIFLISIQFSRFSYFGNCAILSYVELFEINLNQLV